MTDISESPIGAFIESRLGVRMRAGFTDECSESPCCGAEQPPNIGITTDLSMIPGFESPSIWGGGPLPFFQFGGAAMDRYRSFYYFFPTFDIVASPAIGFFRSGCADPTCSPWGELLIVFGPDDFSRLFYVKLTERCTPVGTWTASFNPPGYPASIDVIEI